MWPSGDLMDQYSGCGDKDKFQLRSLVGPIVAVPYKTYHGLNTSRFIRILIDAGAWEVAQEVLVYERYRDADGIITDIAGLQKDLYTPFKMQWSEAKKLCEYEEFFKDCVRIFKRGGNIKEIPPALKAVLPPLSDATPSVRVFFESWLLAYRFGYDSVRTFSQRPALTTQQLAVFHFHARLIVASRHFRGYVCWPRWSTTFQTLYPDLLLLWGHDLPNSGWLMQGKIMVGGNPLLRHKVFFHLAAVGVEHEDWDGGQVRGWMELRKSWVRDRANASVTKLVSNYENSCDLG